MYMLELCLDQNQGERGRDGPFPLRPSSLSKRTPDQSAVRGDWGKVGNSHSLATCHYDGLPLGWLRA